MFKNNKDILKQGSQSERGSRRIEIMDSAKDFSIST